jgi:hypothetical protein
MCTSLTRRAVVTGLSGAALLASLQPSPAQPLTRIVVHRDPGCGCCGAWIEHLRNAGFTAEVVESSEMQRVKKRLGVPQALEACHTAEVEGYVIEGHVPAAAIRRLIAEKPQAKGLAVPGMPAGSPGMEVAGAAPETYSVILFGPSGQRSFARYRGAQEL